jgi:hypothetical protein
MLRKWKWQIPEEPLAAQYNWCQGPLLGRGPAVEKLCSRWSYLWTLQAHMQFLDFVLSVVKKNPLNEVFMCVKTHLAPALEILAHLLQLTFSNICIVLYWNRNFILESLQSMPIVCVQLHVSLQAKLHTPISGKQDGHNPWVIIVLPKNCWRAFIECNVWAIMLSCWK